MSDLSSLNLRDMEELNHDEDEYIVPEVTQYIVVRFDEEQYGIDIRYIDNIIRMTHITRVPKVERHIRGVINVRGEVIPVMSLRARMDLADDIETKSTRILIIKLEQYGNIGVLVDEVKEVVNLEESQIEKLAYDSHGDDKPMFINGIGKYDGGLISLLDLNTVILDKEAV